VVKVYDFEVGIVVFLGISIVITPPAVSIPSESGAISMSRSSLTYLLPSPVRIAA
jgi:hypothetical protein